ncbi:MAG: DUF4440 domain-containing protein [Reyranella sp.]|nr:DUF4440 domain-containing protein [Reyranella sp.]
MIVDGDKLALFRDLETRLHRRVVRNSPESVAALLADDFVEFGRSGRVYGRREVIELLKTDATGEPVEVRDFAARHLSPTVVLVTYKVVGSDRMNVVLRSSIWVLSGSAWQMSFHQGTRLGEP